LCPPFPPAGVTLDRTTMNIDGKPVNLTPGMAATLEIKTGKRKLIEFILSPLMKMADEAGRERQVRMLCLAIVLNKMWARAACAALAFLISVFPVISARSETADENSEIACDHTNIKLESFYAVTIDLAPADQVAKSRASDATSGDSPGQTLTLDIVLHKDSDSIVSRLNARLLGQSLADVLRISQRDANGLIELRPDPAIADVTQQYHDYIGPLAGQETREVFDLVLLMCNPNICKVEVGRPIFLNQRAVYLLFGLRPEHLQAWKSVALALISKVDRWCVSTR